MRLVLRLLGRHLRSGELNLLVLGLTVAVATVSGIALFVDRLQQAILTESTAFIGGDRILTAPDPVSQDWLAAASRFGLSVSRSVRTPSMAMAGDRMLLVSVHAVDSAYPLKGSLRVADAAFGADSAVSEGPAPGSIWVESRVLGALGVGIGEPLQIGARSLEVTRVLVTEPQLGGGYLSLGPRAMMALDDLEASGLVQPGSRIEYRYFVAGEPQNLAEFDAWLAPKLEAVHRWVGLEEGRPEVADAIGRAERFLLLGGSLGVLLAGVAVALAGRRFSENQLNDVAIMKTFGATSSRVLRLYLGLLGAVALLSIGLGLLLGGLVQAGFAALLANYLPSRLPAPGWMPLMLGAFTGMVCLLGFAVPPMVRLHRLAPLRVLRRELAPVPISGWLTYGSAAGAAFLLMWTYSRSWTLTAALFAGATLALVASGGVSALLLLGGRAIGMQAGSLWRLAFAGLRRRARSNLLQILVFAVALMLLLILVLVRTALLEAWKNQVPADAPNHFAVNIAADEVTGFQMLLRDLGVKPEPLFPVVRGRITAVNDESAIDRIGPEDTGYGIDRELSLTWSAKLPTENRVIEGRWWDPSPEGAEVSLEREFAQRYGLQVDDRLRLAVADTEVEARVASIRELNWDSMRPNFYVVAAPGVLDRHAATYLTSFFLAPDEKLLLNDLVRAFPAVSVVEIDAIVRQVQQIVQQVTQAIELVMVLILSAGVLVLFASVRASMDEREREAALLRTLGARRRLIIGSLLTEFTVLGGIAGVLAAAATEVALRMLYAQVFQIGYQPVYWVWLAGPAVGALGIGGLGWWSARSVVQTPPGVVLRGYTN